ncbi:Inhibin beta E chain [Thelohanellus kitauei]|uniref:Inhibin beta E chain n=1 Tax=Thelohanellus kitauei TaxID=669202 RepID=A0A0C2NAW9_THEKT|nr:Inhibin beta E chain [Thelohanellus kitauei]
MRIILTVFLIIIDLTQTKSAGAIVHVRSPEEPYNLIEQRHLCDESSCCPVKMDVDFDKLGWGKLILRPKVFKLSFCAGICESAPSHYTFHSSILMRMIHTYKDKAPKTSLCCAPHELYSYSILFRDHDGMIHNKLIPEVEVKSCICT